MQEVIAPFFEILVSTEYIRDNYYFSGNNINEYGLLILSKWPAYFYDFPFENSWMGRSLLVGETVFNGETFLVCTSHLESLDNRKKRAEQMDYIQHDLLQDHDAIFMGDFNFDFSWPDEGQNVDFDNYCDFWRELRDPSEDDFTMNGTTRFKPVALDHILMCRHSQFAPSYIQRVGNYCVRNFRRDHINDIREDDVVRTPSDHLGLYAVACLK